MSPGNRGPPVALIIATSDAAASYRGALRQLDLQSLWYQRRAAQPDAGGIEHGIGDGRGNWADRAFAGAGRWQFGTVDQHDVDRLGRLADVEYRIRKPVHTRDLGAVESVAAGR